MFRQFFALLPLVVAGLFPLAHAATLNCTPSAAPPIVHGEGITERTSDLVFTCSGGVARRHLDRQSLRLFERQHHQPSDVRRLEHANRYFLHRGQRLRTASHRLRLPRSWDPRTLVFNGATFTLSPSGSVTLQLTGLRGAANQLDFNTGATMQVSIGVNGSTEFLLPIDQLVGGHSLNMVSTSAFSGTLICTQAGSPAPQNPASFASFLAGHSVFTSTRVTEGFADSFAPKSDPQNSERRHRNAHRGAIFGFSSRGATYLFRPWWQVRTQHSPPREATWA